MIRSSLVMLCALAFAFTGCSTAQKTGSSPEVPLQEGIPAAEMQGPPEPYGPTPAPTYGPEPVKTRPIVLVLSPGMARGYAHVGVIRTLVEKSIPIGAIVAAEMGSLVAALYALDPNLNRLEWAMTRFDKEVFAKKGLIATVFPGAASRLDSELKRVFGARDLAEARFPLRVALRVRGTSAPMTISKGAATDALRASLAAEGLLTPAVWQDGSAVSAKTAWDVLVREARDLELGAVVVVNVTDAGLSGTLPSDVLLAPDLRGLQDTDFNKRTEFAFRGSKAVMDALPRLRELTGSGKTDRTGH